MSPGQSLSKCCGPCWFLNAHLSHSLSLVAGQTVVSERRGSVVTVAINRPEVRNAVNQETARRLLEELEAFDRDPDLNVAVLHGKGMRNVRGYRWMDENLAFTVVQGSCQRYFANNCRHINEFEPGLNLVEGFCLHLRATASVT